MRSVSNGLAVMAVVAGAVVLYVAGLLTGAVEVIGYESEQSSQTGAMRSRWFPINLRVPVWLAAGEGVRADFEVEAKFGAVRLSVSPPLILRTSLQAAVAYVEGSRTGSVLFVAQTPGWHTFYAAPSALGGPRCGSAEFSLRRIFIGDPDCPTFDVNYAVTWRLARKPDDGGPRLAVPKPGDTLVTMRIGG